MKYFLVRVEIQDGEHGYERHIILETKEKIEISTLEEQITDYLECGDYRKVRYIEEQEISAQDAKTIEKLRLAIIVNIVEA